jgi:hypothetical protein
VAKPRKRSAEVLKQTAKSFENPDWPEITWHSYSVRWGEADKDPRYADLDRLVTGAQSISTPTLMIQGSSDALGSCGGGP